MKPLSQIAKDLGVSTAAVSYVYNNKWRENRINEKLAKKIMKKIEEENASPDFLARQLRTGKTQTIGVLLADLERHYNLSILAGIEKELATTDNLVLLGNSMLGKKGKEFLNAMIARKVDGLILCPMGEVSSDDSRQLDELKKQNTPVIFIDNYVSGLDVPFVTSDNKWGAYEATKRCAEAGRKKIAYWGNKDNNPVSSERFAGYKQALEEFGLATPECLQYSSIDNKKPQDFLEEVFEKCDALFAESFIYFEWAAKHIADRKIKIPENLMLSGFDEPPASMASMSTEPIPFIRQKAEVMGKKATELLLQKINGKESPETQIFIKPALSWKSE